MAHHALCFPILKLEGTWDPPEVAKPGLGVGLESGRWLSDPWQDEGPAQCSAGSGDGDRDQSSSLRCRDSLPGSFSSLRSRRN